MNQPGTDRPLLRVVPDPGPPSPRPHGEGDRPRSLHRVRVPLPDEPGALARLTAAVAGAGGNILGLSVHGQDSRSVVDEMLVGGPLGAARLTDVVRSAVRGSESDAVLVLPADPHELVDAPTRALDLVAQARGRDGGPAQGLATLLHADEVVTVPAPPPSGDGRSLAVPAPSGGWLLARRDRAPFTLTERARAEAFLRAVAAAPQPAGYEIVLGTGEELTVTAATGDEIIELDTLLRTCLSGMDPNGTSDVEQDWTAADLRAVLLPPDGGCLVVRAGDGTLVALGSAPLVDEPGRAGEPVLLVHPRFRGHRLGRWMRRLLADHLAV